MKKMMIGIDSPRKQHAPGLEADVALSLVWPCLDALYLYLCEDTSLQFPPPRH